LSSRQASLCADCTSIEPASQRSACARCHVPRSELSPRPAKRAVVQISGRFCDPATKNARIRASSVAAFIFFSEPVSLKH
jgi:hypothetical protein